MLEGREGSSLDDFHEHDYGCQRIGPGFQECCVVEFRHCPEDEVHSQQCMPDIKIPKTRDEHFTWVSDEFDTKAWEVYSQIGALKFALTEGWSIFCQMLPHFG